MRRPAGLRRRLGRGSCLLQEVRLRSGTDGKAGSTASVAIAAAADKHAVENSRL